MEEKDGKITAENFKDIPLVGDKSYKDFYKICRAYYKEIKNVNANNLKLSKDDVIVINDVIKELNSYTNILLKNDFLNESKKLIKIGLKTTDLLIKLFNNVYRVDSNPADTTPKIVYPLSLKLALLETNFHIIFNIENDYEESEQILTEIVNIQNILQLPRYYLGCSKLYMAMLKYFKNYIHESERLALEALKYFERKSIANADKQFKDLFTKSQRKDEEDEDNETNYIENKVTRKMSTCLEFLAEIYDLKKEYYYL